MIHPVKFDKPYLTLFVLGKMLEIPELCATLLEELESQHLRSIMDIQGHGYENLGLRTPLGYYLGLQGEDDTLRILAELSFVFVSSDLRNEDELFPSPWYDENGAFRQPYFYDRDKYPHLLEIPTQGWTDNALKGQSRTTRVKVHTLRQELEIHLEHLDFALENNLAYTPLCHPWAVATNDDDGFVIRGMLDYAAQKDIQVVSYKQLYELVSTFSNSPGGEES